LSVSIHDCRVDTFRSGGKGGQNQNKRETGVRVVHEPSGAVGESREERSQLQNKKAAFRRMVESDKFQLWLRLQLGHIALLEDQISRNLENEVKVEVKRNGQWVTV
jgi:hypothetical protein